MKVVVVGAGIIGCSLALSLLERDHEVTLIDPHGIGSGVTGTNYAWINSHKKHPDSYHAINARGVEHWRSVVAPRYSGSVFFNGHVEIADDEEHRTTLMSRLNRLQSLGYEASWITRDAARGLVPVNIPDGADIALFPSEGHAYPVTLVHSIFSELESNPGFTFLGETVTSVSGEGPMLTLQGGAELHGDAIVLCAGNRTSQLAGTAGVELPFVSAEPGGAAFGYIGYATARDHGIERLVTTDEISIRPDGPDALIFQTLDLDRLAAPGSLASDETRQEMGLRLKRQLPDHALEVTRVRVGERVIPADGLTVAGRLPVGGSEDSGLWAISTHSGVVLGPWLGDTIAREISGGPVEPLLGPFRPDRFDREHKSFARYAAPRRPGEQ